MNIFRGFRIALLVFAAIWLSLGAAGMISW